MANFKRLEWAAFLLLFGVLGYAIVAPGAAWQAIGKPEMLAVVAAMMVAVVLLVLRLLPPPRRLLRLERFIYGVFLASMPFIYLAAALLQGDTRGIAIEALGIPVFVGLAIYGYYRSFWVVGAGIIAHGIGWDLWHHGTVTYIAAWYPIACLLADLALGFLALTQLSVQQVPNHSLPLHRP